MEKDRDVCCGCRGGKHYLMHIVMEMAAAEAGFTSRLSQSVNSVGEKVKNWQITVSGCRYSLKQIMHSVKTKR